MPRRSIPKNQEKKSIKRYRMLDFKDVHSENEMFDFERCCSGLKELVVRIKTVEGTPVTKAVIGKNA